MSTWKRDLQKEIKLVLDTAGGRWKWQLKTELDGDKWSVAYVPQTIAIIIIINVYCQAYNEPGE